MKEGLGDGGSRATGRGGGEYVLLLLVKDFDCFAAWVNLLSDGISAFLAFPFADVTAHAWVSTNAPDP